MKPQEKAKELITRFVPHSSPFVADKTNAVGQGEGELFKNAKKCALIAVEEIIKSQEPNNWNGKEIKQYWQEVKAEIEKI